MSQNTFVLQPGKSKTDTSAGGTTKKKKSVPTMAHDGKHPDDCFNHPPELEVGQVNHFSIELVWEDALKQASDFKQSKVKVALEYKTDPSQSWLPCYKGMAKRYTVTELTPKSKYFFHYCFDCKGVHSHWSPVTEVLTTREPLYAENLHMAIKRCCLADMEGVLASGDVSPDVQNEDGFTALMAASKKPWVEGMQLLFSHGADPNFQNQVGKTALMIACTANEKDSIKLLRQHGAKFDLYDNGGCTAVHYAVDSRDVKLIDLIAKDGWDMNIKDRAQGGWTPLIRCANLHGDRDVGLALMMAGADFTIADNNGNTPLHHAVMRKHYDLCQVLMQRRADPLAMNKENHTPWQIASSADDKRRIAALMEPYVEKLKAEMRRTRVEKVQETLAAEKVEREEQGPIIHLTDSEMEQLPPLPKAKVEANGE